MLTGVSSPGLRPGAELTWVRNAIPFARSVGAFRRLQVPHPRLVVSVVEVQDGRVVTARCGFISHSSTCLSATYVCNFPWDVSRPCGYKRMRLAGCSFCFSRMGSCPVSACFSRSPVPSRCYLKHIFLSSISDCRLWGWAAVQPGSASIADAVRFICMSLCYDTVMKEVRQSHQACLFPGLHSEGNVYSRPGSGFARSLTEKEGQ